MEKRKKANHRDADDETAEGSSTNTDCDQDSDVSFMKGTDEEIDTAEIDEEQWIEYMKRSTEKAVEKMKAATITCWMETHRRMKWRLAMSVASLQVERWTKKAAEWNPGLSTQYQKNRPVGRPKKKRWEDEINDFLKLEETAENKMKNNDTWIKVSKNGKNGKQWKVNMQRQQQQHLSKVRHSVKTLRKIQSDQHAT